MNRRHPKYLLICPYCHRIMGIEYYNGMLCTFDGDTNSHWKTHNLDTTKDTFWSYQEWFLFPIKGQWYGNSDRQYRYGVQTQQSRNPTFKILTNKMKSKEFR